MRHLLLCLTWFSGSLLFAQTAETLSFQTDYSANLGTKLNDGQSYATDITGLDVVVFNAASAADASAGTSTGSLVLFKGNTINTSQDYLCQISPTTGIEDDGDYNYPQYLVITTQDKRPFSFQGLKVGDFIGAERTITAEAFYCGKSKGSVTLTMGDLYEKSFGTETFTETIFGMVDEVRLSRGDTNFTGHLAGFNNFRLVANSETVTFGNPADWDAFAQRVNEGEAYLNGKLTDDIAVSTTIGLDDSHAFKGEFDGQGHTLTFNGEGRSSNYAAPFGNLNTAYIHDIHIEGSIKMAGSAEFVGAIASLNGGKAERVTSSLTIDDGGYSCHHVGGVVGHLEGQGVVEKCAFDGTISALQSADCVGGVVGYAATGKIDNCLNAGTVTAPDAVGGILGYISNYGFQGLTNCLNVGSVSGGPKRGAIIGYFRSTVPTSNNYYLEGSCDYISYDKTANAQVVTATPLKNGEVMGLLGGAWTQQWGTDDYPMIFSSAYQQDATGTPKKNLLYLNNENSWVCDNFELTDAINLPVGINFTASQATYLRNFSADARNAKTICLPFSVQLDNSFELYVFEETTSQGIMKFVQKDDGIIESNTPYLLLSKEARTSLATQNVLVEKDAVNDHVFLIPVIDGTFWGTISGLTAAEAAEKNAYTLGNDNSWYHCADYNGYVGPHRAYICGGNSQAKTLTSVLDDSTTLIDAVSHDADGRETHRYYDLSGRYLGTDLSKVPQGVYIDNGQKKMK